MLHEIDLSRADLNLLVLFDTVLREGHVGRAAARLNLSPSAVSHGLGRLRRLLNDPLFLRTPKGVVPTSRALELADPVAAILRDVRAVLATGEPFDPASSARSFVIGAPDGAASVFLAPLLAAVRQAGAGVDIGVRPVQRETVVAELDARAVDLAITPLEDPPTRLLSRPLYQEAFVIAARPDHPFAVEPTLRRYCEARHVVVSNIGDRRAPIDDVLEGLGMSRRVAVAVPNVMLALDLIARSDLVGALPGRVVAGHAGRFGVVGIEPPLALPATRINAIIPRAALADAGLAWLLDLVVQVSASS